MEIKKVYLYEYRPMHGNLEWNYIINKIMLDQLMYIIYVMEASEQIRVHMNSTRLIFFDHKNLILLMINEVSF